LNKIVGAIGASLGAEVKGSQQQQKKVGDGEYLLAFNEVVLPVARLSVVGRNDNGNGPRILNKFIISFQAFQPHN
jgi:hypothetical protein